jgi:hypothetical protein
MMEEHLQRLLLAGTLGLAMARKAAAILEGEPAPVPGEPAQVTQAHEGAVLRAILDAANECLGHFVLGLNGACGALVSPGYSTKP